MIFIEFYFVDSNFIFTFAATKTKNEPPEVLIEHLQNSGGFKNIEVMDVEQKRKEIGDAMQRQRKLLKLDYDQLKEMTGLGKNSICNILKGRSVSVDSIIILARVLGLDLNLIES